MSRAMPRTTPRRTSRAPALVVSLLSLGLFCSHGLFRVQQSAVSVVLAQQKLADTILLIAGLGWQIMVTALPGAGLAVLAYTIYMKWERMTRWWWAAVVVLFIALAIIWALRVRAAIEKEQEMLKEPDYGPTPPMGSSSPAPSPSSAGAGPVVGQVRSGEEVCTTDGKCRRVADPSEPENLGVMLDWKQGLAGTMTDAIRRGEEQVVMVFSREGCPWCERQIPVLRRAIQKRNAARGATGSVIAPALAFLGAATLGSGSNGMLFSPLRVFVLDYDEFRELSDQFRIEAFPTSMVWGAPGVTPLVAKGFLSDENLEHVLRAAALQPPPTSTPTASDGGDSRPKARRRRFFR